MGESQIHSTRNGRNQIMKKTHQMIIKDIKRLTEEKEQLLAFESQNCTVTYAANEKPIENDYSYAEISAKIDGIDKEIRHLKAVLNKSNSITIVQGFDFTLSEALVYLAQLNGKLSRLKELSAIKPISRSSASYRDSSYEYTKALFDSKKIKEDYDACFDYISRLQMAIDLTNLTTEIDL